MCRTGEHGMSTSERGRTLRLEEGGIDIYYVDESTDRDVFVMSSLSVPFLRQVEGNWTLIWEDHFSALKQWRRYLSQTHGIPVRKELKGTKFVAGRGRYRHGVQQFSRSVAAAVYRDALTRLDFLQDMSIISVVGTRHSSLYGHGRLEATLVAMLQRMRTALIRSRPPRQGMIFFDEGHGEYTKMYRKARTYLPTGSALGSWSTGRLTTNLPLSNFTKDANIKKSHDSWFIQVADLVSYALFLKIKAEQESLAEWQANLGLQDLYDHIPKRVLNTRASTQDPDGIVRLP